MYPPKVLPFTQASLLFEESRKTFSGPDQTCYGALANAPQPNTSLGLEGNDFALVESCRNTGRENMLSRTFPKHQQFPINRPAALPEKSSWALAQSSPNAWRFITGATAKV